MSFVGGRLLDDIEGYLMQYKSPLGFRLDLGPFLVARIVPRSFRLGLWNQSAVSGRRDLAVSQGALAARLLGFLIREIYPQASRSYYLFFYYLFFTTCKVFPNGRRIERKIFPNGRRIERGSLPEWSWKTPPNHTSLWKTNDLRLLTIPEGEGYLESTQRGKAADGPLRAGKGEISSLAGLD